MRNMEYDRKPIMAKKFYESLDLMLNVEDLEQFNLKSIHILCDLQEMKKVFSKEAMDGFYDKAIDGMVQIARRLLSVAE